MRYFLQIIGLLAICAKIYAQNGYNYPTPTKSLEGNNDRPISANNRYTPNVANSYPSRQQPISGTEPSRIYPATSEANIRRANGKEGYPRGPESTGLASGKGGYVRPASNGYPQASSQGYPSNGRPSGPAFPGGQVDGYQPGSTGIQDTFDRRYQGEADNRQTQTGFARPGADIGRTPTDGSFEQRDQHNDFVGQFSSSAPGFQENDEGDFSAIPGQPDIDYPILTEVPETSFNCDEQEYPGYYADTETRCQVFHICANNKTYDFLCPNGTIFHQEYLVCVWWNLFDCSTAISLYSINANIYDYSIVGAQQQTGAIPFGQQDLIRSGGETTQVQREPGYPSGQSQDQRPQQNDYDEQRKGYPSGRPEQTSFQPETGVSRTGQRQDPNYQPGQSQQNGYQFGDSQGQGYPSERPQGPIFPPGTGAQTLNNGQRVNGQRKEDKSEQGYPSRRPEQTSFQPETAVSRTGQRQDPNYQPGQSQQNGYQFGDSQGQGYPSERPQGPIFAPEAKSQTLNGQRQQPAYPTGQSQQQSRQQNGYKSIDKQIQGYPSGRPQGPGFETESGGQAPGYQSETPKSEYPSTPRGQNGRNGVRQQSGYQGTNPSGYPSRRPGFDDQKRQQDGLNEPSLNNGNAFGPRREGLQGAADQSERPNYDQQSGYLSEKPVGPGLNAPQGAISRTNGRKPSQPGSRFQESDVTRENGNKSREYLPPPSSNSYRGYSPSSDDRQRDSSVVQPERDYLPPF